MQECIEMPEDEQNRQEETRMQTERDDMRQEDMKMRRDEDEKSETIRIKQRLYDAQW